MLAEEKKNMTMKSNHLFVLNVLIIINCCCAVARPIILGSLAHSHTGQHVHLYPFSIAGAALGSPIVHDMVNTVIGGLPPGTSVFFADPTYQSDPLSVFSNTDYFSHPDAVTSYAQAQIANDAMKMLLNRGHQVMGSIFPLPTLWVLTIASVFFSESIAIIYCVFVFLSVPLPPGSILGFVLDFVVLCNCSWIWFLF